MIGVQPLNQPDARLAGETVTFTVVDGDLRRTKVTLRRAEAVGS